MKSNSKLAINSTYRYIYAFRRNFSWFLVGKLYFALRLNKVIFVLGGNYIYFSLHARKAINIVIKTCNITSNFAKKDKVFR